VFFAIIEPLYHAFTMLNKQCSIYNPFHCFTTQWYCTLCKMISTQVHVSCILSHSQNCVRLFIMHLACMRWNLHQFLNPFCFSHFNYLCFMPHKLIETSIFPCFDFNHTSWHLINLNFWKKFGSYTKQENSTWIVEMNIEYDSGGCVGNLPLFAYFTILFTIRTKFLLASRSVKRNLVLITSPNAN